MDMRRGKEGQKLHKWEDEELVFGVCSHNEYFFVVDVHCVFTDRQRMCSQHHNDMDSPYSLCDLQCQPIQVQVTITRRFIILQITLLSRDIDIVEKT